MSKKKKNIAHLEQYDYYDDTQIEKAFDKYSKLIGAFLIRFSQIEHDLNIYIAETFIDDDHSKGYRLIKNLSFSNKIQLFYEIFLEIATFTNLKNKVKLKRIIESLKEINTFRNKLAHANWSTLTKKGFVRTKIVSNNEDGTIQFINVKILPRDIKKFIENIESIIDDLADYNENYLK